VLPCVSAALFAKSSLLAGLAWSEGLLITFQVRQGLDGALLSPAALALLVTTFTEAPGARHPIGTHMGLRCRGWACLGPNTKVL
jgi:MFS family permease